VVLRIFLRVTDSLQEHIPRKGGFQAHSFTQLLSDFTLEPQRPTERLYAALHRFAGQGGALVFGDAQQPFFLVHHQFGFAGPSCAARNCVGQPERLAADFEPSPRFPT